MADPVTTAAAAKVGEFAGGWLLGRLLDASVSWATRVRDRAGLEKALCVAVRDAGTAVLKKHPAIATDFQDEHYARSVLSPVARRLRLGHQGGEHEELVAAFREMFVRRPDRPGDIEAKIYFRESIEDAATTFLGALDTAFKTSEHSALREAWLGNAVAEIREDLRAGISEVRQELRQGFTEARDWQERMSATLSGGGVTVDQRLIKTFERVEMRAGFPGSDAIAEKLEIADRMISGEFATAPPSLLAIRLAILARQLAELGEAEGAGKCLNASKMHGDTDEVRWAEVAISAMQDSNVAIRALRDETTPLARSLTFFHLKRRDDAKTALEWAENHALDTFTAGGALNVLNLLIHEQDWEAAARRSLEITDLQRAERPAINASIALAMILPFVHARHRSYFWRWGLPAEPQYIPELIDKSSSAWTDVARAARSLFAEGAKSAQGLGLDEDALRLDGFALWLGLELPERHAQEMTRIEDLLRKQERVCFATPFAVAYGAAIDEKAVGEFVYNRIALTGADATDVTAALAVFREPAGRIRFLDDHRASVEAVVSGSSLVALRVEALTALGRTEQAQNEINQSTDLDETARVHLSALVAQARGEDPTSDLQRLYEASDSVADLVALCTALRSAGRYSELADRAVALFRRRPDAQYGIEACRALIKASRATEVGPLLREHWEKVPHNDRLVDFLAWANLRDGRYREAESQLAELRRARDIEEDDALFFNLAIDTGDWDRLNELVEYIWEHRANRSAESVARAARMAAFFGNDQRAFELAREAVAKEDADADAFLAAHMATIAVGKEQQPEAARWLQESMRRSDQDGPVRQASLEELVARVPDWSATVERVTKLAMSAEVPLFAVAKALNRTLVDLIWENGWRNAHESDPRRRFAIPTRWGGRDRVDLSSAKCIGLDLTALLVLQSGRVLKPVLSAFEQVLIPSGTLQILFGEAQRIRFHQPSRVAFAEKVARLVADRKMTPLEIRERPDPTLTDEAGEHFATLVAEARARGAVLVCPAPLSRPGSFLRETADVSAASDVLASTRDVLRAARLAGALSAQVLDAAEKYLDANDVGWDKPLPLTEKEIILDGAAVSLLDAAGIFADVPRLVRSVLLDPTVESECRSLRERSSVGADLQREMDELRCSLRNSLRSGRVSIIAAKQGDGSEEESHPTEVLLSPGAGVDACIIDDRSMNKYLVVEHSDQNRTVIATSWDVLDALVQREAISVNEAMAARCRWRSAGGFFCPISPEELFALVKMAPIENGRVMTTKELRSVYEGYLRIAMVSEPLPQGERVALDAARLSFAQTVRMIWADPAIPLDEAEIRADWILKHRPDVYAWATQFEIDAASLNSALIGEATMLAVQPLFVDATRRGAFSAWIDARIMAPLTDADPSAPQKITRALEPLLAQWAEVDDED